MKRSVIAFLSLVAYSEAQFNFQFNNQGFRFGLLGAEVVNVGGANKDKVFQETFPNVQLNSVPFIGPIINDAITPKPYIPPPNRSVHPTMNSNMGMAPQPILPVPLPVPTLLPQQIKEKERKQELPIQIINPILEIRPVQVKTANESPDIEKVKQFQITPIQSKVEQKIKLREESQPKTDHSNDNLTNLKQTKNQVGNKELGQVEFEEEIKQIDIQQIKRREEQRLIKVIHFLPDEQKQHLRAMSSDKTNS